MPSYRCRVPLRVWQDTVWDVANAAMFLASDEADFITAVSLSVAGAVLVDVAPGWRNGRRARPNSNLSEL